MLTSKPQSPSAHSPSCALSNAMESASRGWHLSEASNSKRPAPKIRKGSLQSAAKKARLLSAFSGLIRKISVGQKMKSGHPLARCTKDKPRSPAWGRPPAAPEMRRSARSGATRAHDIRGPGLGASPGFPGNADFGVAWPWGWR